MTNKTKGIGVFFVIAIFLMATIGYAQEVSEFYDDESDGNYPSRSRESELIEDEMTASEALTILGRRMLDMAGTDPSYDDYYIGSWLKAVLFENELHLLTAEIKLDGMITHYCWDPLNQSTWKPMEDKTCNLTKAASYCLDGLSDYSTGLVDMGGGMFAKVDGGPTMHLWIVGYKKLEEELAIEFEMHIGKSKKISTSEDCWFIIKQPDNICVNDCDDRWQDVLKRYFQPTTHPWLSPTLVDDIALDFDVAFDKIYLSNDEWLDTWSKVFLVSAVVVGFSVLFVSCVSTGGLTCAALPAVMA